MNSMIIIKTTVKNKTVKKRIINYLLNNKLACCINCIEKVTSSYIWKKKIVKNNEEILLIKTLKNKEQTVYKTIKGLHDYDIPEIITLSVKKSEKNYFDWVRENLNRNTK